MRDRSLAPGKKKLPSEPPFKRWRLLAESFGVFAQGFVQLFAVERGIVEQALNPLVTGGGDFCNPVPDRRICEFRAATSGSWKTRSKESA
jgi:hypothetical protein